MPVLQEITKLPPSMQIPPWMQGGNVPPAVSSFAPGSSNVSPDQVAAFVSSWMANQNLGSIPSGPTPPSTPPATGQQPTTPQPATQQPPTTSGPQVSSVLGPGFVPAGLQPFQPPSPTPSLPPITPDMWNAYMQQQIQFASQSGPGGIQSWEMQQAKQQAQQQQQEMNWLQSNYPNSPYTQWLQAWWLYTFTKNPQYLQIAESLQPDALNWIAQNPQAAVPAFGGRWDTQTGTPAGALNARG